MKSKYLITVFFVTCIIWKLSDSKCAPRSREEKFCEADFVVKAKILKKTKKLSRFSITYLVDIMEVFRGDPGLANTFKKMTSSNPRTVSLGADLPKNKIYLIPGRIHDNVYRISTCAAEFLSKWKKVPTKIKQFMTNHQCA